MLSLFAVLLLDFRVPPRYFYEPRANRIINTHPAWLPSDYDYKNTINADTLNERFNYQVKKEANIFRIITLGDSFTFGEFVNTADNYPEQLEDLLNQKNECRGNKFEVINLGVRGYDIEYSVERFGVRGAKYKPDLVIWLIRDDFFQLNEAIIPKIRGYKQEGEDFDYLEWRLRAAGEADRRFEDNLLSIQTQKLASIDDYYKGPLLLLTFRWNLEGKFWDVLKNFVGSRSQSYLYGDLPRYKSLGKVLPDGHPNNDGYSLIASSIFGYLQENKLIPCQ